MRGDYSLRGIVCRVLKGSKAVDIISLGNDNNAACVLTCGTLYTDAAFDQSVNFGTREYLQSAVYDNGDVLLTLFEEIGERSSPVGLTIKPFASYDISTITTAQMLRWTVTLALIPAITSLAVAVIVLVRRRRA